MANKLELDHEKIVLNSIPTSISLDLKKKSVLDDPIQQERQLKNQFDLFEDDCIVAKKISTRYFSYNFNRNSNMSVQKKMQIERELKGVRNQEESKEDGRPSFDSSETQIELLSVTLVGSDKSKFDVDFYYDLCYNDVIIKYCVPNDKHAKSEVKWEQASMEELELDTRDVDEMKSELPSRIPKCICSDSTYNLVIKNREVKAKGAHHISQLIPLTIAKKSKAKTEIIASKKQIVDDDESEEIVEVRENQVDSKMAMKIIARMRSYTLNKKVKVRPIDSEHG